MDDIQIVPVMDIKDGKVIEPVYKNSDCFQESECNICNSSDPVDLASCYRGLGFDEIFVVDLDGIIDDNPNYDLLLKLSYISDIKIMADIGVWSYDDVWKLERIKPVISTGSFSSINFVELPKDFVISLEIKGGELVSEMDMSLSKFLFMTKDSKKLKEVCIVDLDRIGSCKEPNVELCRYIVNEIPNIEVMYGGGIKKLESMLMLKESGIKKFLVGSAVQSGMILEEFLRYKTKK